MMGKSSQTNSTNDMVYIASTRVIGNCHASLETCPTSLGNLKIYHNGRFVLFFHQHMTIA